MKFERDDCKFELPEVMTTRHIMDYAGRTAFSTFDNWISTRWLAASPLIQNWECELMPDIEAIDLDAPALSGDAIDILTWAGIQVYNHVKSLDIVEKN